MDRGGRWIKWVLLLLGVLALAGVASVLFDSGMGPVDDAHRSRHPAGFSIVLPRGWGGSSYAMNPDGEEMLRIAPERSSGRGTVVAVSKLRAPPKIEPSAERREFQKQPAFLFTQKRRYTWDWTLYFQRGASWYSLIVSNPIEIDILDSPLTPFLESFRLESDLEAPATRPSATSVP